MNRLAALLCVMAAAATHDLGREQWEAYKIAKENQSGLKPSSLQQNKYGDTQHEPAHVISGFNNTLENERSQVKEPSRRFLFWLLKKKHQLVKKFVDKILDKKTSESKETDESENSSSEEKTTKSIIDEIIDTKKDIVKKIIDIKKEIIFGTTKKPKKKTKTHKPEPDTSEESERYYYQNRGHRPPPRHYPNNRHDYQNNRPRDRPNKQFRDPNNYPNKKQHNGRYNYADDYADSSDEDYVQTLKKNRKRQKNRMHNGIKNLKGPTKQPVNKNKDNPKLKRKLNGLNKDAKGKQNDGNKKLSGQVQSIQKARHCVLLESVCFPVHVKIKQASPELDAL